MNVFYNVKIRVVSTMCALHKGQGLFNSCSFMAHETHVTR